MLEIILNSLDECNNFSKRFSKILKNGDVISLVGDLGAGKTTFTKFLGKNLGIGEDITSPTFNLVNLYSGKFEFNHMDLYRIDSPEELYQIDYENYFYPDGITVIAVSYTHLDVYKRQNQRRIYKSCKFNEISL